MTIEYEKLLIEIDLMTKLTRAGVLRWEKVLHRDCTYKVIGKSPRIAVICVQDECGIEIGERYSRVNCDDLTALCGAIIQQIRRQKEEASGVAELLHTTLSPTSTIIE